MAPAQLSYLIVGAGIFGASTALHLKAAESEAQVTLLDRTPYPCPYGASFDLNKIIRDYYTDKFYMKLANEAQQQWRNGDEWKSFYYETGLFVADDSGLGRKMIQNYEDLAYARLFSFLGGTDFAFPHQILCVNVIISCQLDFSPLYSPYSPLRTI